MKLLKKIIRKIRKKRDSIGDLAFYKDMSYLDAYAHHTNLRVKKDPHSAIGGRWDEIGNLQFEFLKAKGLKPTNRLLDIGCGTLRGGRYFIKYLNKNNYWGFDISEEAISYSKLMVEKSINLKVKEPNIFLNKNNLNTPELSNEKFDYLLAQSVFTHLMPEHIKDFFININKILHENSRFYFTYLEAEKYARRKIKDFVYPFSFFEQLANDYNLKLTDVSNEYKHPKNQKMCELQI